MLPKSPAVLTGLVVGGAAISLLIGHRLIPQLILLSSIGFLATGHRYKWLYILYKTLPRDISAVIRFLKVNILLWWWEKKKRTVPQVFCSLAQKHPHKVAFHFEHRQWTYAQVDAISNQVASYFKAQGYKRDDTVALFMDTRPEYVCLWLGLSKIGVVAALINSNLRQGPLVHSISVANSRAVIYGAELSEAVSEVRNLLPDLKLYQFSTSDCKLLPGATDLGVALKQSATVLLLQDIAAGRPTDRMVYIYTSGTTGLPKAAVINHMRYMFMVVGVNFMLDITAEDTIYNPLPLYHTAGGMIGIGQVLLMGATVVLRNKFSASNFWIDCVAYKCTIAQYIGEICRYLLATPEKPEDTGHQVRLMFGNGLRPQIWRQFVKRFHIKKIGEFYGATEGNSNLVNIDSTVGAVGFVPRYAGSIYPVSLVKADENTGEPIRNHKGLCIRCQPGETGVFIGKINSKKAISSFTGYADKKASEKKIIHDVFSRGDQYFNSGDILIMDELGYFYFKDRTGDTFRWRGENVATSEVEAVISNVIGLKDAVVYGIEIPNVEGRAGMVAIVDEEGTLNLTTLADGMRQNLPSYARPLFVRVLQQVPMTGTYKLKKRELQIEGYNPESITDKLFFMDTKGQFVTLTKELHTDIITGKMRL